MPTYTAHNRRLAAAPRSKRQYASTTATPNNLPIDQFWFRSNDNEGIEAISTSELIRLMRDFILYAESGNSPKLVFQRAALNADDTYDWQLYVNGGRLKMQLLGNTTTYDVIEAYYNLTQIYSTTQNVLRLINSNGGSAKISFASASTDLGSIGLGSDEKLTFWNANGNAKFKVDNNGNILPTTTLSAEIGSDSYNYLRLHIQNVVNNGNNIMYIWNKANYALSLGTNNASRVHITSAGLVGINTQAPNARMHVNGDAIFEEDVDAQFVNVSEGSVNNNSSGYKIASVQVLRKSANGDLVVSANNAIYLRPRGTASTVGEGKIDNDGNLIVSGGVMSLASNSSDQRLKTDVQEFCAIELLKQLHFVSFRWNDTAKKHNTAMDDGVNYGLIAQEAQLSSIDGLTFKLPDSEMLGVRYDKLIPIIGKALQEQTRKINLLEERLARLESIIQNYEH